ncbi:MAG TPA: hypothetical protein VFG42_15065 [Baekduia sp.]|uniref:hypothetical protein n=1 Tax=Baekduia sp. TaxID=2600305 RepID=UPI002D789E6E|nr:hypothetical protein [Baekduia sp.]HET6508110.1 hypothetical protein [Baekduia sp.]
MDADERPHRRRAGERDACLLQQVGDRLAPLAIEGRQRLGLGREQPVVVDRRDAPGADGRPGARRGLADRGPVMVWRARNG